MTSIWCENMHGYLSADIICYEKRTVFRERIKLEETCELRGTDNVKGQISVHIFEAKWRPLCLLSFKYFFSQAAFWARPFLNEGFKHQSKSVGAQNILSLFKMFSSIHFNNLLGIKTKRAKINRKVRNLGNITWGNHLTFPSSAASRDVFKRNCARAKNM